MLQEFTDSNFEEFLAQEKPMVVDFWATWCGPCRKIGPYIEELANQYADQVLVGKVDVDDNNDLAVRFGVRNIPTVLFIKNGTVIEKQVGATTKSDLEARLQKLL